jgi:hypothetical protein
MSRWISQINTTASLIVTIVQFLVIFYWKLGIFKEFLQLLIRWSDEDGKNIP